MLITNDFVLLNFPKTGSSFARSAIKEIYEQRRRSATRFEKLLGRFGLFKRLEIRELMLPNIKMHGVPRAPAQHGCYVQIPKRYRHREIVSVIRNPYTRFLSEYEYGWWASHPPVPPEIIGKHFPHFPALSIDDFVLLKELTVVHSRLNGRRIDADVGNQTVQFIQMFFKDPTAVLERLSNDYLDEGNVLDDMPVITFLSQETLNDSLAAFLERKNYSEHETAYVRGRQKSNVTQKKGFDRDTLWTPKALEYIRHNERMLFRIYASKGFVYEPPQTHMMHLHG